MKTTTFETAKAGDRVWCMTYGWGAIRAIVPNNRYPVQVDFLDGKSNSYSAQGKEFISCGYRTLFWGEVVIEAPHKPLPELAVDTKVFVWDDEDTKYKRHFSHFINGRIFAFDGGSTSFTAMHKKSVTGWNFWELAE